jgi:hypothetical protein
MRLTKENEMEEWNDIVGWEGYYQIGSLGGTKSLARIIDNGRGGFRSVPESIIEGTIKNAYRVVTLSGNGVKVKRKVHQLVLESFVGPCPEGMEACHNDGNELNNSLSNLRWDTHANNMRDKARHGTNIRGETVGTSKLTEQEVLEIREKYSSGSYIQQQLAEEYGVSQMQISDIINRKWWAHV